MMSRVTISDLALRLALVGSVIAGIGVIPSAARAGCVHPTIDLERFTDVASSPAFKFDRTTRLGSRSFGFTFREMFAWIGRSNADASSALPCMPCQRDSTTPGRRCEGPHCSGLPTPVSSPAPVLPSRTNESAVASTFTTPSASPWLTGYLTAHSDLIPLSVALDSIFHPPRSHDRFFSI